MRALPADLRRTLEGALHTRILSAESVAGGMINHAARVETSEGPLFVKWRRESPPDFFLTEAAGLVLLRASGILAAPEPLAHQDGPGAFLALEWMPARPFEQPERQGWEFGAALARLHRECVSPNGLFGLDHPNYLGNLPQPNPWTRDWSAFYRDSRLRPQVELAHACGRLPPHRHRLLQQVMDRVETLLRDAPQTPSLIHGDLWSGNFLACGRSFAVVDPAVSYSEREVEMAYVQLFGGFPRRFMEGYESVWPLDSGYPRRRALYQLYPLLVHLNHFGEMYGPDVESACTAALGM